MREEIITILIAMTPTLEAHGAITTAMGIFKFSAFKAFALSSLGTVVITPPLLVFWRILAEFFMRRIYWLNRFLNWLFNYTRRRHSDHFEKYNKEEERTHFWKAVALYVFIAIPGPFTGVWGGSIAAYVFGIPFKYALISIVLGALSVAFIDVLIIAGVLRLIF